MNGAEILPVDAVLVGVGQIPNVEWLKSSGLDLQRGLVCDAHGRTQDPHVFGVGDAGEPQRVFDLQYCLASRRDARAANSMKVSATQSMALSIELKRLFRFTEALNSVPNQTETPVMPAQHRDD